MRSRLYRKLVDSARSTREQAARRREQAAGRLLERYEEQRRGSRKRTLPLIALGFAALAGMFQLVSANVLAVNFTTGDKEFSLYSNYLDAHYAAGFLGATSRRSNAAGSDCTPLNGTGSNVQCGVAELGINQAKLAGLCVIVKESIGLLGSYSLVIRSGLGTGGQVIPDAFSPSTTNNGTSVATGTGGSTVTVNADGSLPATTGGLISANNLFVNSNALNGYGNLISGLNLGQDASTVATQAGLNNGTPGTSGTWPTGQTPPVAGNFGLYATQLNVADLDGSTYGLNLAGSITLPQLSLKVVPGSATQVDCS